MFHCKALEVLRWKALYSELSYGDVSSAGTPLDVLGVKRTGLGRFLQKLG